MSGALFNYELDTPTTSDEIFMPSGLLALNGQQFSDFNIAPLAGFGQGTYTLIDAGMISGSLGANASGTIGAYPAMLAVQGTDLVLNVAPEPSNLTMLLAAAVGPVWSCKRRLTA